MAEMQTLDSSNVDAAGWDQATGRLTVRYRHGGVYVWPGISQAEYQGLLSAGSPGQYLRELEQTHGKGVKA